MEFQQVGPRPSSPQSSRPRIQWMLPRARRQLEQEQALAGLLKLGQQGDASEETMSSRSRTTVPLADMGSLVASMQNEWAALQSAKS